MWGLPAGRRCAELAGRTPSRGGCRPAPAVRSLPAGHRRAGAPSRAPAVRSLPAGHRRAGAPSRAPAVRSLPAGHRRAGAPSRAPAVRSLPAGHRPAEPASRTPPRGGSQPDTAMRRLPTERRCTEPAGRVPLCGACRPGAAVWWLPAGRAAVWSLPVGRPKTGGWRPVAGGQVAAGRWPCLTTGKGPAPPRPPRGGWGFGWGTGPAAPGCGSRGRSGPALWKRCAPAPCGVLRERRASAPGASWAPSEGPRRQDASRSGIRVPLARAAGSRPSAAAAVAPTSARLAASGSSSTPRAPGRWTSTGTYSRVW